MTNRPEMHRPTHDAWDQGGYCNELVIDHDGETATICGYRESDAADPSPEYALAEITAPQTAIQWLTERLVESANLRINERIRYSGQAAVDRLYRMHSGPSGICHCGNSSLNHQTIDDHAAADIPIDKAWAVETPA